jgi:hypothetical protein
MTKFCQPNFPLAELRSAFSYNPATGEFLRSDGRPSGVTGGGYLKFYFKRKWWSGQRLIWYYFHGVWPEKTIDHKDRNAVNNRIDNLREASDQEQKINRGLHSNNTSGARGVYQQRRGKKWMSLISVNGKLKYLGTFAEKSAAEHAYKKASLTFFRNEFLPT